MATVANPFGIDQEDSGQGQTTDLNSAPTTGGATSGISSIINSPSGGGSKPTNSSGSFQNLSKYINANNGFNSSNGGLAGTVANNIGDQAQQTQQNIQGAQSAFNQQAGQNVSAFNNTDAVNQAITDPYGFTQSNPQGTQQVLAAENAQYTGPQGLQDLQGSQNLSNLSIQNANINNLADQTKSQSGQYNLLRQMFGTPSYTNGQQNLDQLIMNNAPGAQNQFSQARQQASGVGQNLTNAQQQSQQQAGQDTQLANQVQANTRGGLNQAVVDAQGNIQTELTSAQQNQQNLVAQAQKDLTSGNLTAADYAALGGANSGLTNGEYLYNLPGTQLSSYITAGTAPTAQTVATGADYNKLNALNQLMGGTGNSVANANTSSILQSYTDPTLAGTATNGLNFDQGGFQTALQQATNNYNTQVQGLQSQQQAGAQINQNSINSAANDLNKYQVLNGMSTDQANNLLNNPITHAQSTSDQIQKAQQIIAAQQAYDAAQANSQNYNNSINSQLQQLLPLMGSKLNIGT